MSRPCGYRCPDPAVFGHIPPCPHAPPSMPPLLAGPLCPRGRCAAQHELPAARLTLRDLLDLTRREPVRA